MRFACGTEIGFHAQVHFERPALEPAAAAHRELRRFGDFRNAQEIAIEPSRLVFAMSRHGKLNMFDCPGTGYANSMRSTSIPFIPWRVEKRTLCSGISVGTPERLSALACT